MRINIVLSLVSFVVMSTISHAQTLRGTVIDAASKEPLPYATVVVLGKNRGGITEANGTFNIQTNGVAANDSVKFSYLGYRSQVHLLGTTHTTEPFVVALKPIDNELPETKIIEKAKTEVVGDKAASHSFTGWGDYKSSRGRARGLLISPTECNSKTKNFVFRINENTWDSVRFRLLMLSPDIENGERKSLLRENIFFNVSKTKNKWITVNLSQYNIILCDKFILGVEWVDAWGQPNPSGSYLLTISLSGKENLNFTRGPGQENGNFEKSKTTPAMYLEVFK
jgi:hypothetical protein